MAAGPNAVAPALPAPRSIARRTRWGHRTGGVASSFGCCCAEVVNLGSCSIQRWPAAASARWQCCASGAARRLALRARGRSACARQSPRHLSEQCRHNHNRRATLCVRCVLCAVGPATPARLSGCYPTRASRLHLLWLSSAVVQTPRRTRRSDSALARAHATHATVRVKH